MRGVPGRVYSVSRGTEGDDGKTTGGEGRSQDLRVGCRLLGVESSVKWTNEMLQDSHPSLTVYPFPGKPQPDTSTSLAETFWPGIGPLDWDPWIIQVEESAPVP